MNPKPWYKSATAWSIAVSFLSHLAGWAGVPVDDAGIKAAAEILLPVVGMGVDAIGLWGRSRAQGPLTLTQSGADRTQLLRSPVFVSALAAALMLASISGCTTLKQNPQSAGLVVKYATLKFVEKAGDAEAQAARAVRVRIVAEDVQKFATGESVTIAALEAAVRARLPADLSPADRFLVDGLIIAVMQELQERVGAGLLSSEQLLEVKQVIGWVIEASAYAAPPPTAT